MVPQPHLLRCNLHPPDRAAAAWPVLSMTRRYYISHPPVVVQQQCIYQLLFVSQAQLQLPLCQLHMGQRWAS